MNTTRMHPRTLNEAFRHTADYGCAVERTRPADRAVMWACAAGVIVVLLSTFFWSQP